LLCRARTDGGKDERFADGVVCAWGALMDALMIQDSSVGRARVGCWRRVRVGATTLRTNDREAEQRPRARCQWLNRVRSAVTQKVNSVEAEIVNVHQELSKKSSGQLRNPG